MRSIRVMVEDDGHDARQLLNNLAGHCRSIEIIWQAEGGTGKALTMPGQASPGLNTPNQKIRNLGFSFYRLFRHLYFLRVLYFFLKNSKADNFFNIFNIMESKPFEVNVFYFTNIFLVFF